MPAIPPDAPIGKNVVTFSFLCNVPILKITPTLAEDECAICKDSYRNNGWRLGGTLHRPVKLRCGHVFGFQCLARWMLTANPVARCPLCRGEVLAPLSTPDIPERLREVYLASFACLETLGVVAGSGISQIQKKKLLSQQRKTLSNYGLLWEFDDGGDRIMVAWEELLNSMCKNESAAPSQIQTRQQPVAATAVARPPRDNEVSLIFSHRQIRIALFFSFMAMAYVGSGPIWDYFFALAHTVIGTILSAWLWIVSTIVAYNLWFCRVPWNDEISLAGTMGGVVFAGIVRLVDLWIYERFMRGAHVVEHTVYWG